MGPAMSDPDDPAGKPAGGIGRREVLAGLTVAPLLRPALVLAQGVREEPLVVMLPERIEVPLAEQRGRYELRLEAPLSGLSVFDASPEQLAALGLPPRPDRDSPGFASWQADSAQWRVARIQFGEADEQPQPYEPAPAAALRQRAAQLAPPAGRPPISSASDNWAGAFIRSVEPLRFREVGGRWTIPAAWLPAGATNAREFRTSQWIGFDGADPRSRSLPQVGSQWRHRTNGTVQRRLWWQWWIRGAEIQEVHPIGGLQMMPGDEIEAKLTWVGPRTVSYLITRRRLAALSIVPFTVTANPVSGTFPDPEDAARVLEVEGRVAEWMVERPRRLRKRKKQDWLYRLPAFDTVVFSDCYAVANDSAALRRDLGRARLVRITDWDDAATPGLTVARVWNLQANGFEVRYEGHI